MQSELLGQWQFIVSVINLVFAVSYTISCIYCELYISRGLWAYWIHPVFVRLVSFIVLSMGFSYNEIHHQT